MGGASPRVSARSRWRLPAPMGRTGSLRSEEHTSELQSQSNVVCRLLLEKKHMAVSAVCRITAAGGDLHPYLSSVVPDQSSTELAPSSELTVLYLHRVDVILPLRQPYAPP